MEIDNVNAGFAYLVLEYEDIVVIHEVFVDIFERAASCLGIKEIYKRHEESIENGPDDVELPLESPDTDGSDLHHDEIA